MTTLRLLLSPLIAIFLVSSPAWSQVTSDPEIQEPLLSINFRDPAFPGGLRFSDDGSTIWIKTLNAWNVETGEKVLKTPLSARKISSPLIDIAGQTMLIANRKSGDLLLWRENGQPEERKLSQSGELTTARLLDQGKRFALVFADPLSVYFGHVETNQHDSILPLPLKAYRCKIAPNGNLLAIREEREVKIWDLKRQEARVVLKHEHKLFSHAFSPDSRLLATGSSNDNLVRIFDTENGEQLAELSGHGQGNIFLTSAVYSLAFSPDGKRLASGGHDGRVIVWDVETHQSIMKVSIGGPPIVCAVAFSPNSESVACCFENAGAKRGIRMWRIPNQDENR